MVETCSIDSSGKADTMVSTTAATSFARFDMSILASSRNRPAAKPTQAARTSDSSSATTAGIPASHGRRPLAPKATSSDAASMSA